MFHFCSGAFDDEEVIHVDGEVNPIRDLETINDELRLKDIELLAGVMEKMEKNVGRTTDKKLKQEFVSQRMFLHWREWRDDDLITGYFNQNQRSPGWREETHSIPGMAFNWSKAVSSEQ